MPWKFFGLVDAFISRYTDEPLASVGPCVGRFVVVVVVVSISRCG